MTREEMKKLKIGLYRVYWKTGSLSVAALGMNDMGDHWLAPSNWTRAELMSVVNQDSILRMELITTQQRELDAQKPDSVPHGGGPPLRQILEVNIGSGGTWDGNGFVANGVLYTRDCPDAVPPGNKFVNCEFRDAPKDEERLTFSEWCQRFTEFNREVSFRSRFKLEPLPAECDGMFVVGDDGKAIPHDPPEPDKAKLDEAAHKIKASDLGTAYWR